MFSSQACHRWRHQLCNRVISIPYTIVSSHPVFVLQFIKAFSKITGLHVLKGTQKLNRVNIWNFLYFVYCQNNGRKWCLVTFWADEKATQIVYQISDFCFRPSWTEICFRVMRGSPKPFTKISIWASFHLRIFTTWNNLQSKNYVIAHNSLAPNS